MHDVYLRFVRGVKEVLNDVSVASRTNYCYQEEGLGVCPLYLPAEYVTPSNSILLNRNHYGATAMRMTYCFIAMGLFAITLCIAPAVMQAQDNPNLDTPPLRSAFGPTPVPLGVQVITTPDGFDNFDLGTTNAEPHISMNPLNPLWSFNAFNTNSAFRTTDGTNWTGSSPNFGVTAQGDPLTAYDSLGNLYYETMYGGPVGCKIIRSTDNGATWNAPLTSVAGNDKNWLACDQTMGPYANYVYTCMTPGNFARSTDLGATWTTTWTASTQALPGMMVAVGPNVVGGNNISGGCVYVVTHSGTNAAGIYTFYVSTDGGLTFTQKSSNQFPNLIGTEVSGRSTVQAMRCRPYPMIASDNSFGAYRGRLYLAYASNNPVGGGNKSDVYLRYSTDQGATWSAAAVVNDDPNSENNFQFHPAIWCDKETGRLYIKFYDTRRVPTSDSMDVYATYTDNGGATFAANQRLTNRTSKINFNNAAAPAYKGDYDAITSNRHTSLACWTDFRNSSYLGMTAYFPDYAMLASAARDTLKFTDSTTVTIKVPAVKLYTRSVKFSAAVSPAAPFVFTWQGRDSLTSYPDSVVLKIKTNNVVEGNYVVTVTGQGPNGTPVHRRTIPIRVQFIPNAVRVTQPNGGEIWVQGQTKQIKWAKTGDVSNVRVEYSTNNGSTWTTVNASVPAATGSLNWTVPATPTIQGRARVAWVDSLTTILDASDAAFTISGPTALIATTPDSLRAVVAYGNNTGFDTLRISNSGTVTLTWSTTGTAWANALPGSGSVPADSTRPAPVRFSANGLLGGTYLGNLTVASNDAFRPSVTVPMRLTVVGIAQIVVTPRDSLNFGAVRLGRTDTLNVRVRNSGSDTLRGTTNVNPPGRFSTITPNIKLAPNDSTIVRVIFTPLDSTSSYTSTLRILNNDPDPADDTVFVALRGRGTGLTSVQISSLDIIPDRFSLEQNYPNPFNPSTTIRFGIPTGLSNGEAATLKVFDLLGREVAILLNEKLSAGMYSVKFETGGLASGIYFYRLAAGKFIETKKMSLLK